jgi:hypothetical protein
MTDRDDRSASSPHPQSPVPLPSAAEVELPALLAPGCEVEGILARAEASTVERGERALIDRIRSDLVHIRREYQDPAAGYSMSPTRESRYSWALAEHLERSDVSATLRFSIAAHEHLAGLENYLWNFGCSDYMKQPDHYDRVLGEFIPAQLRTASRRQLALNAYYEGSNATAALDWLAYQHRLSVRRRQRTPGLVTGLPQFDQLTGGLPQLTFLGGGPGTGKTSLALALAVGALRNLPDLAVIFHSLDMPKDMIYDRLVCGEAGLDYASYWLSSSPPGTADEVAAAEGRLTESVLPRLRVIERVRPNERKPDTLRSLISSRMALLEQCGCQRALHVIDYFQLLDLGDKPKDALEADARRIELLQSYQEWSRSPRSPVGDSFLVISEVRKGETGRSRLAMEDLLGSARIAYSADCILLLESDNEVSNPTSDTVPFTLTVAKGRDGMSRGRIALTFDYTRYRFRESISSVTPSKRPTMGSERTTPRGTSGVTNPLAGGQDE